MIRILLLKLVFACTAMSSYAGSAAQEVAVRVTDADGSQRIEGRFSVEASSRTVWAVLTDYDGIARFVSSLRLSRVRERQGNYLVLEQVARAGRFLFSRKVRVLLRVHEEPFSRISFEDTARGDFGYYKGSWRIAEANGGCDVAYELEAKRNFAAPNFLAKGIAKKNVKSLMREVRSEIIRRASSSAVPENDLGR